MEIEIEEDRREVGESAGSRMKRPRQIGGDAAMIAAQEQLKQLIEREWSFLPVLLEYFNSIFLWPVSISSCEASGFGLGLGLVVCLYFGLSRHRKRMSFASGAKGKAAALEFKRKWNKEMSDEEKDVPLVKPRAGNGSCALYSGAKESFSISGSSTNIPRYVIIEAFINIFGQGLQIWCPFFLVKFSLAAMKPS